MVKKLDSEVALSNVRSMAKSKGGKCLSTSFLGRDAKLELECENGHLFTSTYDNVVYEGAWYCEECYKEANLKKIQE